MNTLPQDESKFIPILDENYDDYLEWTSDEESEFLKILEKDKND